MKDFLKVIAYSILFIAVPIFAFGYTVGTPPTNGPQLIDGTWSNGLANGNNRSYQYGIRRGSPEAAGSQSRRKRWMISGAGAGYPPLLRVGPGVGEMRRGFVLPGPRPLAPGPQKEYWPHAIARN